MLNALEAVKKAALDAVEASKPVNLLFGQVISATPLKIQVDQKSIYTEKMLVLTRNVTDFEVDMTVSQKTEIITHGYPVTDTYTGGGTAQDIDHDHPIKGRKKFKVHNALVVGDQVVLARVQRGKKFVVLDRIKPHPRPKGGMVMIPQVQDDLKQAFVVKSLPSRTFKMHHDPKIINGHIDKIQAVEQSVYLILNTERYEWLIHSWNYGVELRSLIGKDVEYCIPEIERRVREALLQDDKITAVENFAFEVKKKSVLTTFAVVSIFGGINLEMEVEI